MNLKKIQWDKVILVLVLFFMIAYVSSPHLKSWITRGLMQVGFFKPDIPDIKPDSKFTPAPAIQIEDSNNKVFTLQDEKGKVVFINFWATWCPPCLAELPSINALYEKEKNNPDVVFITVDIDKELAKTAKFMQLKKYSFPVYIAYEANKLYNVGISTTLVINKKGDIVFSHFNRANYNSDQFEAFIDKLVKQP